MTSYPTATFTRPGLAPSIIAAIVLVAGSALVGSEGFIWIRYPVSILAIIVCVFAVQARKPWWILVLAPIAISWNPVVPIPFEGIIWQAAQFVAALAFVLVGVRVKVPNPEDRNPRR